MMLLPLGDQTKGKMLQTVSRSSSTDSGTTCAVSWPKKSLDRLAIRVIDRAIADAISFARKGQIESRPLLWLWDTGREWAEARGGPEYKRKISNICEEIEIMAYEIQAGREYRATGKLAALLERRRRFKNSEA